MKIFFFFYNGVFSAAICCVRHRASRDTLAGGEMRLGRNVWQGLASPRARGLVLASRSGH